MTKRQRRREEFRAKVFAFASLGFIAAGIIAICVTFGFYLGMSHIIKDSTGFYLPGGIICMRVDGLQWGYIFPS